MKLTKRQQEILDYLKEYYATYQSSPTHQEMADHFGLRAKSTIFKHLRALERKGLIQNDFNRNQAVRVVTQLTPRKVRRFHKIVSRNNIETNNQSELILYPLNVDGHQFYLLDTEAFRGEGLFPGDILALAVQVQYQSGDYLLMQKADGELRIGFADFPEENIISIRFQRKGSLPEFYEAAEIHIIGKIFHIYRYFK